MEGSKKVKGSHYLTLLRQGQNMEGKWLNCPQ